VLVTLRSWKFESSSGHQFKFKVQALDCTETRESGFLRFWPSETSIAAAAIKTPMPAQGASENQYRLSLLQVFAMRQ
jgi:hypothetical protein